MGPNANNTHSSNPSLSPRLGRGFLLALTLLAASLVLLRRIALPLPSHACCWSAASTGTRASTRRSRRPSTRPSRATGCSSPRATTTSSTTTGARRQSRRRAGRLGGVYITTPDLHLRGMDRNTVVVDGTKPGSSQCSSRDAGRPGPRAPGRYRQAGRAQRRRGVEGRRQLDREPHRLQLPHRQQRRRQRDLVERRRRLAASIGMGAYNGALPVDHLDLLRRRRRRRRPTGSS